MHRTKTRIAAAAVSSLVALAPVIALAAPANAATKCTTNSKSFNLPLKPDVTVKIRLCANNAGSVRTSRAYISWKGSGGFISPPRFNLFKLNVRLEKNDVTKASYTQYYEDYLDVYYSHDETNFGSNLSGVSGGGWTADGTVKYDIADDGIGNKTWNLTGSPKVG